MPSALLHRPIRIAAMVCTFTVMAAPLHAEPAKPDHSKDSGSKVRMVFLSTLAKDGPLVLATPAGNGRWAEYAEVAARDSFITDWLTVSVGPVHLTLRTPDGLVSTGSLTVPAGTRSMLAVVTADPDRGTHTFRLIDPAEMRFSKGATLLMNFSDKNALVVLGGTRVTVDPQATVVARPAPEDNGMYRLMTGCRNPDGQLVICYDRYVSTNPQAREYLFLLPDANLGLKVLSLPEFGETD